MKFFWWNFSSLGLPPRIRIHMDIFWILDPHNNRCGSATLVQSVHVRKYSNKHLITLYPEFVHIGMNLTLFHYEYEFFAINRFNAVT